jgi:DNA-binding transcriptional MerR regulator
VVASRQQKTRSASTLMKISELAERCQVPSATIKHYVREGLVVPAKTGRNIAWFDEASVQRVARIKELQQNGYLPLRVIKEALSGEEPSLARAIRTIQGALDEGGTAPRSRSSVLASGARESDLTWLETVGALTPVEVDGEPGYSGDDLELLRVLSAARRAGLTPEMVPLSIVGDYVAAIQRLVDVELQVFREGVLPRAGGDLAPITRAATKLSEKLVTLIRKKLIVPTLEASLSSSAVEKRTSPRKRKPRRLDALNK